MEWTPNKPKCSLFLFLVRNPVWVSTKSCENVPGTFGNIVVVHRLATSVYLGIYWLLFRT